MDKAILNWAGNIAYGARSVHFPRSVDELVDLVSSTPRLRALGSRHSFNGIADSDDQLVSLSHLDRLLGIDRAAGTVTVEGGITYGQLCPLLEAEGLALHNLASLPHISVAGAVTTATHGSGERNGNLATAVRALDLITADGETVRLKRGDPYFEGAVVGLGALGIISSLTLAVEPSFAVAQTVYTGLPVATALAHFDALCAAAYSVSLFTMWNGDTIDQVWLKRRDSDPAAPAELFGATPAERRLHPISIIDAAPCTEQLGVPGPWHQRLPHFRMEFTPSAGAELQSEYFVPRNAAIEAFRAIDALREHIAPHLLVSEIRMVAADTLWLSMNHDRDSVAFHFTWKPDWPAVQQVLPRIEAALLPFDVRPHWGKLFTLSPEAVQGAYPRLGDFRALLQRLDPGGKFRNPFLDRYVL